MPAAVPGGDSHGHTAPIVNVPAAYTDDKTGAVFIFNGTGFTQVIKPYEFEDHIEPPQARQTLGDVASWVAYVQRFAAAEPYHPLLTYSASELHAVLDYHSNTAEGGRCDWHASMPFVPSKPWHDWTSLADDRAKTHEQMIEFLENHLEDIQSEDSKRPTQADMMNVLRGLKVFSNTTVDIQRREDGTQAVVATGDQKLTHRQGDVALPATIRIRIQVLKGDQNDEGTPITYQLDVRLRASVSKDGVPSFRFAMPMAERVMELVIGERVKEAQQLLGDGHRLLRAG